MPNLPQRLARHVRVSPPMRGNDSRNLHLPASMPRHEVTHRQVDRERRAVLAAGLAAGACSAAAMARAAEGEDAMPNDANGQPLFGGRVRFDTPARDADADDFGHLVHRAPAAVVLPASDVDVARAIRWGSALGRKVAARGNGHSVFGRSQALDGVVIEMAHLRKVHGVTTDRIVVDAGATWRDVLAATLAHGLTPPVLTDYLDLSVGGTLAVGGVGATSARFGVQTDNVLELDVVTGAGQRRTCSPARDAGLFDAVRAGLGQVGVITRATLRLVPAPRSVRRFTLVYAGLAALLHDAHRLVDEGRFETVQCAVRAAPAGGWMFALDASKASSADLPADAALLAGLSDDRSRAQATTLPWREDVQRFDALEQKLRASGHWVHPHPWLTTFAPASGIESIVEHELRNLRPADLGAGQVVLTPMRQRAITTPLLRLPAGDACFAFNLIRLPASDDPAQARRLVAANRAVYERVRAAGGTLYPVSAFAMSAQDWRHHFGPAFEHLLAARRRYDPRDVLTPGYEVFAQAGGGDPLRDADARGASGR